MLRLQIAQTALSKKAPRHALRALCPSDSSEHLVGCLQDALAPDPGFAFAGGAQDWRQMTRHAVHLTSRTSACKPERKASSTSLRAFHPDQVFGASLGPARRAARQARPSLLSRLVMGEAAALAGDSATWRGLCAFSRSGERCYGGAIPQVSLANGTPSRRKGFGGGVAGSWGLSRSCRCSSASHRMAWPRPWNWQITADALLFCGAILHEQASV